MITVIKYHVELEDGRILHAVADQRDLAHAEGEDISRGKVFTFTRFVAWSALSRKKEYTGSWEQFNSKDCVEVEDESEESPDTEQGLDPGN